MPTIQKMTTDDRHSLYDPIEDMDLTNALVDIVKAAVSSNMKDYRKSIETDESGDATKSVKAQLDGTLQQLQDLGPQLQANLQAIENTNKDLTQNINDQLAQYADLQKRLEEISECTRNSDTGSNQDRCRFVSSWF